MALPLDPHTDRLMDVEAVAPFVEAPALEDVALSVMARFDEFRAINEAVAEGTLSIGYAWETKPYTVDEEVKPHTFAKVTKAPGSVWATWLDGRSVAMQFRQWFWDRMSERTREAIVHHELSHIEVRFHEKTGDLILSLREHDIEDFSATMRRFGPVVPGRKAFINAYLGWDHEQEHPEPVQLRTLPELVEAIEALPIDEQIAVHAVVKAQVAVDRVDTNAALQSPAVRRALRRLVDAGTRDGGSMTVTAGGRSVTIGNEPETLGEPDPATADSLCPYPGCVLGADHGGAHAIEDGKG